jgi:hypothetical protein
MYLNIAKLLILIIIETEEKEIEVLTKLKETVDKQRDEVRKQKREFMGCKFRWWFSHGTPVSSTNKTDRHDITEIL